jgi:aspartyl-tRNA(Asn)/glutamyl-tRNA(Gln) amidotransferase subunit A
MQKQKMTNQHPKRMPIKKKKMNIRQQVENIKNGKLSAEEHLKTYLTAIENNKELNAFISLLDKRAREKAKDIDARIKRGDNTGRLCGTVIAVKDNITIKGTVTTCASKILDNFRSPYNATVIERLEAEDALIIGKTNLDEFAMGSSTENSYFGPVKNPNNTDYVPGGSSGGSAVAVAVGMAQVALGSDTGGSIRQPAAYTGVVGLKPSYGRVSRYGLVAYASSLDQIGTFSTTVEDSAYLLQMIAGWDENDTTSAPEPVPPYTAALEGDVQHMRIGIPKEYFAEGLDSEIKEAIEHYIDQLRSGGATIVEISLPHSEYAIAAYYIIAMAEASSNLARYDSIRYGYSNRAHKDLLETYKNTRNEGFGDEVKRRILLGTYVLSAGYYDAYYKKAQQVRRLIKQEMDRSFKHVDCILTPTTPTTAFKIGEKVTNPLSMYLMDVYTVTANLAGICGINIPVANDRKGLPIGLQLMAAPFKEENLFCIGNVLESMRT